MTYFICRIPFGTSELKIKTLNEIPDSTAEEISYFINAFYNELNPNLANTSAYNFNHGQIGIPIFLKKEFLDFLSQHLELAAATEFEYQPFSILDPDLDLNSNLISVDKRSLSVTKNDDISLESPINRKHFTIDILSDFLIREKALSDFLIVSDSVFLARGKHPWAIDITDHTVQDFTLEIRNESVVIEPMEVKTMKNTFGVIDEISPVQYIFIQGKYTNLPKIIGTIAKRERSLGGLSEVSRKYGVTIHALDKNDKLTTFTPRH
ncbi:MAG: hypothetical protein ABI721_04490 [Candidatus Dojkabacteria bacterium]